ncbi:MAG: hypothetical protein JNJ83_10785 [Verrucomicrobiaceae bacterium]|nr:hypothetical protein [Verrucomicrobiaceae bacterium]
MFAAALSAADCSVLVRYIGFPTTARAAILVIMVAFSILTVRFWTPSFHLPFH